MLYRLYSCQTNLHISLHHQSDVLWHNGTICEELLFSSDISGRYIWQAYAHAWLYMSRWPDVILLLTTRCLYWGGHLTNIITYNVVAFQCNQIRLILLLLFICNFLLLLFICMYPSSMKNNNKINLHRFPVQFSISHIHFVVVVVHM